MSSSYEDQIRVLREIEERKQRGINVEINYLDPRKLDGMVISAGVEPTRPTRELPDFDVPLLGGSDYDNMKVFQLASHLRDLKSLKDEVKALHTAIGDEYDFLSTNVLPERMEDEGIETLKIKDVGRLQSASDIRCNVPAANREALQEWLIEAGFDSMVKPDINSSTLKAFVKECIADGKPYPQDLLKVTPFTRATVVKA